MSKVPKVESKSTYSQYTEIDKHFEVEYSLDFDFDFDFERGAGPCVIFRSLESVEYSTEEVRTSASLLIKYLSNP